jgi:hypothetical protein
LHPSEVPRRGGGRRVGWLWASAPSRHVFLSPFPCFFPDHSVFGAFLHTSL